MNKNTYCILTLVFIFSFYSESYSQLITGWEEVEIIDNPNNQMYLDVYFLPTNPDFGWICGFGSTVSRTNDGGLTWQTVKVDSTLDIQLESIQFLNENVGYASGPANISSGVIYKSTDGGATWNNITPQNISFISLWGLYFWSENDGVVIGGGCGDAAFLKTTNGGDDWGGVVYEQRFIGKLADPIIYPETGLGYAVGSGTIWTTEDYGENWSIMANSTELDWHEEMTNVGNSFLFPIASGCNGGARAYGGMTFTTDGGENWNRKILPGVTEMYGSYLIDETTGWAVGNDRGIYFTCDAGETWTNINCGTEGDMDDIWFIDDTTAWVVGENVYKSKTSSTQITTISNDTIVACSGETIYLDNDTNRIDNSFWANCNFNNSAEVDEDGTYTRYYYRTSCDTLIIQNITVIYRVPDELNLQSDKQGTEFCDGDTVSFSVNTNLVEVYWSTGDEGIYEIDITESGEYYVTAIDSGGCTIRDTFNITFRERPDVQIQANDIIDICIGDSTNLSSVNEHTSYRWLKNGVEINENTKSIVVKEPGTYKLYATNEFGCLDSSDAITVDVRNDSNRLELDYDSERVFIFDSLDITKSICADFTIYNDSEESFFLRNIFIDEKIYFSYATSSLPATIPPNDSIDITLCFEGDSIGNFRDRVLLEDNCRPHSFPLLGNVKPLNITKETRCEIPWSFESRRLADKSFFENSAPYPNPTSSSLLSIKFIEYDTADNEPSVELYNMVGEKVSILLRDERTNDYLSIGNLTHGVYRSNANLRSGTYYIKITYDGLVKTYPVSIVK